MATAAAAGTSISAVSLGRLRAGPDDTASGKPSGCSSPAFATTASRLGRRSGSSSMVAEPCQTADGRPPADEDPADLGIPILASSALAGSELRHSPRASASSHCSSRLRSCRCPMSALAVISVACVAPTASSGSSSSVLQ
jgi:hypothetical protein